MPSLIRKDRQPPEMKERYRQGQTIDGKTICGGKTQDGHPCRRPPMPNGRCRFHGGKSLAGPAHPNWKGGRTSKYMPRRLLERYEASMNDPDLMNLTNEISIVDARIAEIMERLDDEQTSHAAWMELRDLWKQFMKGVRSGDTDLQNKMLPLIHNSIDGGATQEQIWEDVYKAVNNRRRLVDTERKRLQALEQNITIEQCLLLVAGTVNALKEVVYQFAEPEIARKIIAAASDEYKLIVRGN